MVIIMPPGYAIEDKTGWLSDRIVTDPELLAKFHAHVVESTRREHPGESIIDLTSAGSPAAKGETAKKTEKPEKETPLTYKVTGSTGNSSIGTGLLSFESVLELLMSDSGHKATVEVLDAGDTTIDEIMEHINAISKPR